MDAAAPNTEATPLRPMYWPMSSLPTVNSSAVMAAPIHTSRQATGTRGIHL
ncbi:hypothetical protein FQZ97_1230870 [compost metagenome]